MYFINDYDKAERDSCSKVRCFNKLTKQFMICDRHSHTQTHSLSEKHKHTQTNSLSRTHTHTLSLSLSAAKS